MKLISQDDYDLLKKVKAQKKKKRKRSAAASPAFDNNNDNDDDNDNDDNDDDNHNRAKRARVGDDVRGKTYLTLSESIKLLRHESDRESNSGPVVIRYVCAHVQACMHVRAFA